MPLSGKRVVERRNELRYKQQDLAKLCGISRNKLYRIEHDILKNPIPQTELEALADVLQCNPDYLTEDSDTPQTDAKGYVNPFSINRRATKASELYELAKRDFRFVDDLIYMQKYFSYEEINMIKHMISFLRKNHEHYAAIAASQTKKDPE